MSDDGKLTDERLFNSDDYRQLHEDGWFPLLALSKIVAAYPEELNQDYTDLNNAQSLLRDTENHPELRDMLRSADQRKSTFELRKLAYLRIPADVESEAEDSPFRDVQASATRQAWEFPYTGSLHEVLRVNVNDCMQTAAYPYSNFAAVVQSSGTGKSRLVHEHANLHFTIPFNIRNPREDDNAYPPSDRAVYHHLYALAPLDDYTNQCQYYLLFIKNILISVREELTVRAQHFSVCRTIEDLAAKWRKYLEDPNVRSELYSSACAKAQTEFKQAPKPAPFKPSKNYPRPGPSTSSDPRFAESAEASRRDNEVEVDGSAGGRKPSPASHFVEDQGLMAIDSGIRTSAREALNDLSRCIASILGVPPTETSPLIVLYFDEAHTLTAVTNSDTIPSKRTRFIALTAALEVFVKHPLFALFLSTNSTLNQFSPPHDLHPSVRIAIRDSLQAPITETSFDCLQDDKPIIYPREKTLEEVSQVAFMARFGRPLWTSRVNVAPDLTQTSLIDFACAKLLGKTVKNYDQSVLQTATQQLAVLDTRLLLTFEPLRQSARVDEADLVRSHMRTVFIVPQSREYMRSGYPSEPILAEAAARLMWNSREKLPEMLAKHVGDGLISKGSRGELVARLILMLAFDEARDREYRAGGQTRTQHPDVVGRPVMLETFIRALFPPDHAEAILDSTPDDDKKGLTFSEAFKDAQVRFTHFAQAGDDTGPTTSFSWAAIVRGMAVQCYQGQPVVDIVVPIALRKEKLSEETMTAMLIQVKTRGTASSVTKTTIDEQVLGFFPMNGNETARTRPYITLVMELGVQPRLPEEYTYQKKVRQMRQKEVADTLPDIPSTPTKFEIGRADKARNPNHPRYSIRAIGCSPAVYGVVKDKDKFALLLGCREFLGEHSHRNGRSLEAVRRLKPFFVAGLESFDWIKNDFLQQLPGQDEDTSGDAVALDGDAVASEGDEDEGQSASKGKRKGDEDKGPSGSKGKRKDDEDKGQSASKGKRKDDEDKGHSASKGKGKDDEDKGQSASKGKRKDDEDKGKSTGKGSRKGGEDKGQSASKSKRKRR